VLTQVTGGRYAEAEAAWSPDGESIVFVSSRVEDPDVGYGNNLWIVPAKPDGAPERVAPRQLTTGDEVKISPAFSPDGRQVAYLSAVDGVYGISRLAMVPAAGGEPVILTGELDRWVSGFRFSDDGRFIWFQYDNHGGRHLGRVRLSDGRIERMLEGDLAVNGFDVDDSGNAVLRLNHENDASDLYRLRGGKLERLTNANRDFFADLVLGSKEKISYTSTDDTLVEAFVTKPPGFEPGRRYPTILDIHGGPVGQFSWGYDFGAQYFAANGFVVVQPNPRGSTGRGQAFIRAIQDTWGITDYPDVVGAVDRAVELGYADPEALAVTGYSYGGYMTNVVITRTGRFKAAASGAGHSYISANYGHDIYQQWYNWELGVPWDNREKYDRLSPLLDAGKVTTPTLFLGGREDWNVPILNAELFYQSLKVQGIDSQLVVYPDSHHGGWDERFDKDYLERVVAWFNRYTERAGSR
jgi:dipeptidyl aminopeptidase/acylaminoacyl peptidase